MHPQQYLARKRINDKRKKELITEGRANQQKLREVNKRLAEIKETAGDFGIDAVSELEGEAETLKSEIADCVAELNEIGEGKAPRAKGSPKSPANEDDDRVSGLRNVQIHTSIPTLSLSTLGYDLQGLVSGGLLQFRPFWRISEQRTRHQR
jgi:hypothetical protein